MVAIPEGVISVTSHKSPVHPFFQIVSKVQDACRCPKAVYVFFQLHLPCEVAGEVFVVELHIGDGFAVRFFDLEDVGERGRKSRRKQ